MVKRIITLGGFLVIVVAFVALMVQFGPFGDDIEGLEGVEVTQYEGKDLSSINDFRENSIRGSQYVDAETYRLEVNGLVDNPASYSYEEVLDGYPSYEKVIRLNCVEGWSVDILWEGVLLKDLLGQSSPQADTVIFYAYDGYTTALPLDYLYDNDILLAYKMNGVSLPPERGFPFALAAESKWGFKWIKWVTRIEVSDNASYLGFWERAGYSNTADIGDNYFNY